MIESEREREFAEWMRIIDVAVNRMAHIRRDDLTDYDFRGAFDSDMSPVEVAVEMLRNDGWFL